MYETCQFRSIHNDFNGSVERLDEAFPKAHLSFEQHPVIVQDLCCCAKEIRNSIHLGHHVMSF